MSKYSKSSETLAKLKLDNVFIELPARDNHLNRDVVIKSIKHTHL